MKCNWIFELMTLEVAKPNQKKKIYNIMLTVQFITDKRSIWTSVHFIFVSIPYTEKYTHKLWSFTIVLEQLYTYCIDIYKYCASRNIYIAKWLRFFQIERINLRLERYAETLMESRRTMNIQLKKIEKIRLNLEMILLRIEKHMHITGLT